MTESEDSAPSSQPGSPANPTSDRQGGQGEAAPRALWAWTGLLVVAALSVLLGTKILRTATLFGQPTELTWPEAANVFLARRVEHGGPLYGDWRQRPQVAAWYGPLLYLPVAYLGRWTGADEWGLFILGRGFSLLYTVGTALLIVALLVKRRIAPRVVAVLMGLVFITSDTVFFRHDFSFRADAPACFWTVLGCALVVSSTRRPLLYGSLMPFLLAFLCKQSSIAGPISAALWLAGRRREAIRYAAIIGGLILGAVAILEAGTGRLYLLNNVDALRGNTTLSLMPFFLLKATTEAAVPLDVAIFVVVVRWVRRTWDPVTVFFAVSFALAVAGTYRDGAWLPYYMPPLAIGCVLCGEQLGEWWRDRLTLRPAALAVHLTLCVMLVRYVPSAASGLIELPEQWRAFRQRQEMHLQMAESQHRLADYLNRLSGPILSQINDLGLYCRNSVMIDTFTFTSMADVKVFDDSALVEQIRSGAIAAIVLDPKSPERFQSTDCFSRRWRAAMEARYRRVDVPGLPEAVVF